MDEAAIWQALRSVKDPELGVDIVSLGLVYTVVTKPITPGRDAVYIKMTLTTPGCPLAGVFDGLMKDALVRGCPGLQAADVEIELTFDPPWFPDMMSEEAKAELDL